MTTTTICETKCALNCLIFWLNFSCKLYNEYSDNKVKNSNIGNWQISCSLSKTTGGYTCHSSHNLSSACTCSRTARIYHEFSSKSWDQLPKLINNKRERGYRLQLHLQYKLLLCEAKRKKVVKVVVYKEAEVHWCCFLGVTTAEGSKGAEKWCHSCCFSVKKVIFF